VAAGVTAPAVRLVEITGGNRDAVRALRVHPGQERFVALVAELVRAAGGTELLTSHQPGEDGPGAFYRRLGFRPTGQVDQGETVVRLVL
jgi:hypothetical protein